MAIVEVPRHAVPQIEREGPAWPQSVEMGKDVTRLKSEEQIRLNQRNAQELARRRAVQNLD